VRKAVSKKNISGDYTKYKNTKKVTVKGNKVKATEIEVLPQNNGQYYVVTQGLNIGDKIVVEGVNKLSNDMEIKPITPQQSEAQQKKSQQHMAEKKMPGQ